MRFEREDTIRILERQHTAVQVIELGRMVDLFRPAEALRLLRSQPRAVCWGRGSPDVIKFVTIQVDEHLQVAINGDLARKLPKVHATPQANLLKWAQQPTKAHSGRRGGRRAVWGR